MTCSICPAVGLHPAQIRLLTRGQLEMLADQAPQHFLHVGDDVVQVENLRSHDLAPAKGQQLARQRGCLVAGLQDFPHILLFFGTKAILKNLAVAENDGEQVVEVMGNAPCQLPDRLHFHCLTELVLPVAGAR